MSKIYAGVDLGGTTAKLGLFKKDGTLITKWEIPTRKEEGEIGRASCRERV